jgi:prepilin-type N-terminal cleavage/methylation domain-containing protein
MLIPAPHTSLRSERGFTLIEVLVAMVTGVIVTGALFAILEVSMRQSTRVSDVAQATQLGRTAMNHVVDELHSACIAASFAPVQATSGEAKVGEPKLVFINGYSEAAEVPSVGTTTTGVREDEIIWSESAQTLTDKTYLATAEPKTNEFTFAATATPKNGVRLAEHVVRATSPVTGEPIPIFQYYEYGNSTNSSTTTGLSTLEALHNEKGAVLKAGEKLGSTPAKEAASVLVTFSIAPTDNATTLGRAAEFSSQNTFTFSAPNSENPLKTVPCE